MSQTQAGLLLLALVLVAYLLMWRGWRRRGRKHDVPVLVPVPAEPPAEVLATADARYYGSTVAGDWLDRVVARGLGVRSPARLTLSADGLDVTRSPGSFRIPRSALRAARHDAGIAGKVLPPHGLLVITWSHGDLTLDTGFRLVVDPDAGLRPGALHEDWVRQISSLITPQEDPA